MAEKGKEGKPSLASLTLVVVLFGTLAVLVLLPLPIFNAVRDAEQRQLVAWLGHETDQWIMEQIFSLLETVNREVGHAFESAELSGNEKVDRWLMERAFAGTVWTHVILYRGGMLLMWTLFALPCILAAMADGHYRRQIAKASFSSQSPMLHKRGVDLAKLVGVSLVAWLFVPSAIRYRVFRDAAEVTPATGISGIEFIDIPPSRGTTYTYTVKTMINNVVSQSEASDTGFVPACRAARLIGASLNADMSAINGLIERWECLEDATGSGAVDAGTVSAVQITGSATYRSFSYVLDPALADGAHVLRLGIESKGVVINTTRSYDIPFTLGRSSISLKSLTILYDGSTAQPGLEATSIGRFGARMEGGTGLGFAEEIK